MKKKMFAVLMAAAMAGTMAMTVSAAGEKIALITMDSIDQHWISLNEGAQKAAEELDAEVTFMSPNTKDDAQQIECVNNAVAGGYQAILVAANGPDAISSALKEASDAGVKIVYVDSPANVEAEATFSTDNKAAGTTAGEEMIKALEEKGITSGKIGIINQKTNIGWLPEIFGSKYLLSIIVAVIVTVVMYIYFTYSKQGYEISVVGESVQTARYVGIKVEKVIIRTMLISGGICGLVGLLLVGGINHTVTTTIANGQGFTAVMVSWMAKFNPFVMIFTSFLIIFMNRGASEISTTFGLNQSFADILTGIILFFIIGCEFFISYQIHFRKKAERSVKVND